MDTVETLAELLAWIREHTGNGVTILLHEEYHFPEPEVGYVARRIEGDYEISESCYISWEKKEDRRWPDNVPKEPLLKFFGAKDVEDLYEAFKTGEGRALLGFGKIRRERNP